MEDLTDLSKMKVADLKKQLKSRGLSVTGNKNELVERLQESLQTDAGLDPNLGADDEEFDEEEILGGDVTDIDKITQEEEAAALAGTLKIKSDSLITSEKPKKKISLKRSEPPALTEAKEDVSASNGQSNGDKENSVPESTEPKHKIIKLSDAIESEPKKSEPIKVTPASTDEDKKKSRAERFAITFDGTTTDSAKPNKLSMETGGTDMEKLKKRAERFGEVTSKSLNKLTELEKQKGRKERFASTDSTEKTSTTDVEAAKEKRAERFASSDSKTTTATTTTATSTTEEAKAKRAQRFAA